MCPNTPFSYKISPIDVHIVIIFILGKLYYGKKQPAFIYVLAAKRSIEPIIVIYPSGWIKKAIEGLAI
jgi:hypothetical protein